MASGVATPGRAAAGADPVAGLVLGHVLMRAPPTVRKMARAALPPTGPRAPRLRYAHLGRRRAAPAIPSRTVRARQTGRGRPGRTTVPHGAPRLAMGGPQVGVRAQYAAYGRDPDTAPRPRERPLVKMPVGGGGAPLVVASAAPAIGREPAAERPRAATMPGSDTDLPRREITTPRREPPQTRRDLARSVGAPCSDASVRAVASARPRARTVPENTVVPRLVVARAAVQAAPTVVGEAGRDAPLALPRRKVAAEAGANREGGVQAHVA